MAGTGNKQTAYAGTGFIGLYACACPGGDPGTGCRALAFGCALREQASPAIHSPSNLRGRNSFRRLELHAFPSRATHPWAAAGIRQLTVPAQTVHRTATCIDICHAREDQTQGASGGSDGAPGRASTSQEGAANQRHRRADASFCRHGRELFGLQEKAPSVECSTGCCPAHFRRRRRRGSYLIPHTSV